MLPRFIRLASTAVLPCLLVACDSTLDAAASPAIAQAVTVEADRILPNQQLVLPDGTPIKLRLSQTVSSADAHTGQEVSFEVENDIQAGDVTVLPAGSKAFAIVTEAQAKRSMGRPGRLDMTISYAVLADGEKVPLRPDSDVKNGARTEAIASAMSAPFLIFAKNRDSSIPQGTEIMGFVNGDTHLDRNKFDTRPGHVATNAATTPAAAHASEASAPAMPAAQAGQASLTVDSVPAGADIEVDGNLVGSTPSSIPVTMGAHQISVKKNGYATWTRKVDFEGGNVHLNAELDRVN